MAFASIEPFTNATLEAFYQFEWQPLDAPPPGSYFATNDLGTNNAGKSVHFSFGSAPDDPARAFDGDTANTRTGSLDTPLALITLTTGTPYPDRAGDATNQDTAGTALTNSPEPPATGTKSGATYC